MAPRVVAEPLGLSRLFRAAFVNDTCLCFWLRKPSCSAYRVIDMVPRRGKRSHVQDGRQRSITQGISVPSLDNLCAIDASSTMCTCATPRVIRQSDKRDMNV